MIATVEIELNKNLDEYKKGDRIKVVLNGYWRNRIKDKDVSLYIPKNKERNENKRKKEE